jgi:hypothetical protein
LGEIRNRLAWAVHMNPKPKEPAGEIDLEPIFDGVANGSLKTVKQAIEHKNATEFTIAYRQMLEDCYSCHKAIGRPYLRPMQPTTAAMPIVNANPNATWPQ